MISPLRPTTATEKEKGRFPPAAWRSPGGRKKRGEEGEGGGERVRQG